jgi:hypothetical protein
MTNFPLSGKLGDAVAESGDPDSGYSEAESGHR